MLPEATSLVVKFAELRRKISDLLVVNSDVILPRFTLFKQRFQRFALVRRCESGNRFPFHAVEVVLEPVKRSLTENVVQPLLHVLTEVLDVQRPELLTIDEEALRNGWREQRFNPRTNGLQPLFTCFKP